MIQQFVETIKIKNGEALGLSYHQARMERTIRHFFPELTLRAMPRLDDLVKPKRDMDFYKARVVYGDRGVETTEYAPYSMRNIRSLQVVSDDAVDYSYKSCDRSALNALVAKKGCCDDIVIVKNGLVTDTSFTNIAVFDGSDWLTPKCPLLLGTKRAYLLDSGIIKETDITIHELMQAQRVRLFNAMIEFGEIELDAKNCML